MYQVEVAALLHDVGKVGVPDAILKKQGPLTSEERALINRHPEYSWVDSPPLPDWKARVYTLCTTMRISTNGISSRTER